MGRGQTWCGSIFEPKVRAVKNWKSTQIFAIDVDNNEKITPLSTLTQHYTRLGFPPNGWYFSLSSKEEQPKYRLIWITEEPVEDIEIAKGFNRWLIKNSLGAADACTIDVARLFFGGKNSYNTNHPAIPNDIIPVIRQVKKKRKKFVKRDFVKDTGKLMSALIFVKKAIANPAESHYVTRYRCIFNGAVYLYSASDGVWDEERIWNYMLSAIEKNPEHWADYHHTYEDMQKWIECAVEWAEDNVS